jgi:hypothetical protein
MSKMQEKIAQRSTLLQRMKGEVDVPRMWREWEGPFAVKKTLYRRQMDALRRLSKRIERLETRGKGSVRQSMREARRAFINGYYPTVFFHVNKINEFVWKINQMVNEFVNSTEGDEVKNFFLEFGPGVSKSDVARTHEELTGGLPETAASESPMIKEADLQDLWEGLVDFGWRAQNFFSGRQRAMKAMERVYPQKAAVMREAAEKIMSQAEGLFDDVKESLRQMAGYVQSGEIEEYVLTAERLFKSQQKFNKDLTDSYNRHFAKEIGPLVESELEKGKEPVEGEPPAEPPVEEPVAEPPAEPELVAEPTEPPTEHPKYEDEPEAKLPEEVGKPEEEAACRALEELNKRIKIALEQDEPRLAAALLTKYSDICEEANLEMGSIAALAMAEDLLNG